MHERTTKEKLNLMFEALSNDHRREIVFTLNHQPRSISELAEQEHLSLPAIHKHIDILEAANLIVRKKSGRTNYLALNKSTLHVMQDWIMQYHTYWGDQENTLDAYIASVENRENYQK